LRHRRKTFKENYPEYARIESPIRAAHLERSVYISAAIVHCMAATSEAFGRLFRLFGRTRPAPPISLPGS
jgi:hypothetical protein